MKIQYDMASGAYYDYIVDSQDKFDVMIASATWFGAKNVLFTTNVTSTGQTTIPATVEKIHAVNEATLTTTTSSGQYGLGYAATPTTKIYEIRNLCLISTGGRGFSACSNLYNCSGSSAQIHYVSCENLINCSGIGSGSFGYGFYGCNNLINCWGGSNGGGSSFYSCSYCFGCRLLAYATPWAGANTVIRGCEAVSDG